MNCPNRNCNSQNIFVGGRLDGPTTGECGECETVWIVSS